MQPKVHSRRQFITQTALTGAAIAGLGEMSDARAHRSPIASAGRPLAEWGLQFGDVFGDGAIVWSRADRASRLIVEWSLDRHFNRSRRVQGPLALESADFTARVDLRGLPRNADVFVRAHFEDPLSSRYRSEPLSGRFRTAPDQARNVRFVWGGDTAGQGWGIDLDFGGMKLYEAMRKAAPDFLVHSGDNIYADGPMLPEVVDAAGSVIWRNAHLDVIPEKLIIARRTTTTVRSLASRTSTPSGSSSPAHSMPAASARTHWMIPSAQP